MIWLASYPRSGNTFVRNILHDVYGLSSGEYHLIDRIPFDKNYTRHPFVKTHLLPDQIEPSDPNIKAVYLVRDGRDSIVSMAHQRSDIIEPGSDLILNMEEAIMAEKGSYFGGWATNVKAWLERCDIIIRYEDLIEDPLRQIERLRHILELPAARPEKLPTFEASKKGDATYGTRKEWGYSEEEARKLAGKIFRRGKKGSWKSEMPEEIRELFWALHGDTMGMVGYTKNGDIEEPDQDLDHSIRTKLNLSSSPPTQTRYKILIEANKMATNDNDGVKRYVSSLINGLAPLSLNEQGIWEIDLLVNKKIIPLRNYLNSIEKTWQNGKEKEEHQIKPRKGFFTRLEAMTRKIIPDRFVEWLNDNNISLLHNTYELFKRSVLFILYWLRQIILFPIRIIYTLWLGLQQKKEQKELAGSFADYDLIHLPLQQHHWPFRYAEVPLLCTIHDFTHKLFPRYHTRINIKNADVGLELIKQKQAHILAVSRSTLKDCKQHLSLPDDHYHMVYESLEEGKFWIRTNRDEGLRVMQKYGINSEMPFILLLGTLEPRKNIHNCIEAFKLMQKRNNKPNIGLVIAGKKGWKMEQMAGYSSYITFTGFVDDEDLPSLYSEALTLSYVSHYEGFGLPILEAMRCGTPVVYGNNSSMPEVAGEGGLPANPDNIEDICEKYEIMCFDEKTRKEMSKKAIKQSNSFSPRQSTLELLEVYRDIISKNTS